MCKSNIVFDECTNGRFTRVEETSGTSSPEPEGKCSIALEISNGDLEEAASDCLEKTASDEKLNCSDSNNNGI